MTPNRSASPARRLATLTAALALAVVAPLRADSAESYRKALDAVGVKDWAAAATWLEQAIAEAPEANPRIRLSETRSAPYVPYFYLGVARYGEGDCERALEAFETSESEGVIRDLEEYATLQDLRGDCEERGASDGAAADVVEISDVKVVEEGSERATEEEPEPASPQPTATEPVADPVEEVAAAPGDAAQEAEAPEQGGGEGRPAEPGGAGERPAGKDAASAPLEVLRTAKSAYRDGEYRAVLEALSGQRFEDEGIAAQAFLFRAAASYALYLLGGEEDEELMTRARDDVANCRRLDPDLRPDPEVFFPRFVALFEGREE